MARTGLDRRRGAAAAALVSAALMLAGSAQKAEAQAPVTTTATLLDRIQIEDLLIAYYAPLGSGGENFAGFYTADGVLDINGRVYHGPAGIRQAYKDAGRASGPASRGKFHMLLTNPRIVVSGDTATADAIWTGIASTTVSAPPHLVEQGREHDVLVKRQGRWLIRQRMITSDGGLPAFYAKTYRNR